ncbi:hypothetical protein TNCV_818371 [Trichonephila clavipes]|nr:hypothetical protein TNCV_818371 [Trichonephila clavipes]
MFSRRQLKDHQNDLFPCITGVKLCFNLSPNHLALRIACGTETSLVCKENDSVDEMSSFYAPYTILNGVVDSQLSKGCSVQDDGCSSPVTNRGCNFSPSMNSTPSITNAASVVAQSKKDRDPGLGRWPGSINNLRSPNSLKIIQFNINGISTSASRIKLDQVLELALTEGAQIIALQKTKLKTFTSLKIKGYNMFRKITDGSNLEIQGIRIIWRGKPLNIFNMYHPPDLKSLPSDLLDLFTVGTICLGDLNAKRYLGLFNSKPERK